MYIDEVESSPLAIFIQTDGCFSYLNPRFTLFDVPDTQAIIGKPVTEHIHPEDRDKVAERIRKLNEEQNPAPVPERADGAG